MLRGKTEIIGEPTVYCIRFTDNITDGEKIIRFESEADRDLVFDQLAKADRRWVETEDELPPNSEVVHTKCHHKDRGATNEQDLKREGRLWFYPDSSMYVYYVPTHWKRKAVS